MPCPMMPGRHLYIWLFLLPACGMASGTRTLQVKPGVEMPYVSLGLGSGQKGNVSEAVADWISVGGVGFDTALLYGDQPALIEGLKLAHISQDKVFITSKVWCASYEETQKNIQKTLQQLQVPAVDLLLIHAFPNPTAACGMGGGSAAETWRALEDAFAGGLAKAIGVSSFGKSDLEELSKTWKQKPHLNQGSLAVGHHEDDAIEYCRKLDIAYMAYSPLCGGGDGSSCKRGNVLQIPEVQQIAKAHKVSPAQVALKWIVQQGHPLACASWKKDYMKEDLDLWSWGDLTSQEMDTLLSVKPSSATPEQDVILA